MNLLVTLTIAFAPGIFWLWLINRWDRFHPEPRFLIIRTFLIGAGIAVPVAIVEAILYPGAADVESAQLSIALAAYLSFIVAGFTEELGKFLIVRVTVFKSPHFDELIDGLIYSSAAALGFASLENFVYLLSLGWELILVRGIFSTLAHVFFAAFWGYPLALYKVGIVKTRAIIWVGLILAMAAHGLFDFFLFSQNFFTWLVIPLFLGMAVLFWVTLRHANRVSHGSG